MNCANFRHRRPGFASTGLKWLPKWKGFWWESPRWEDWDRAWCQWWSGGVWRHASAGVGLFHTTTYLIIQTTYTTQLSIQPNQTQTEVLFWCHRPCKMLMEGNIFISMGLVTRLKSGKVCSCCMLNSTAQRLCRHFKTPLEGLGGETQGFFIRQPHSKQHWPFLPLSCRPCSAVLTLSETWVIFERALFIRSTTIWVGYTKVRLALECNSDGENQVTFTHCRVTLFGSCHTVYQGQDNYYYIIAIGAEMII